MTIRRCICYIKTFAFLLLLCICFSSVQDLFITKAGDNFRLQEGFFKEPADSLDVVYIGASPTFTSWITPIAYEKYGITSWVYANNSQPFVAVRSFLELAYKEQPNAVFMICINGLYDDEDLEVEHLHASVDNFRPSFEKLALIDELCNDFQSTPQEQLELLFPIVRYHSRWNTLNRYSFHQDLEEYKGGYYHPQFFTSVDISTNKVMTNEYCQLPDFTERALNDLLDFCTEEKIRVVFVLSAQYRDERTLQWYNTMMDVITSQGFPFVNELEDFEAIGLDETKDFYNGSHTNIHGALKITDYLSQYLLAHYDFPEKAGGYYKSWDEAYDNYMEIITPYLTEIERSQLP